VDDAALSTLTAADIPGGRSEEGPSAEQALAKLDKLVGLQAVKDRVRQLVDTIEFNRMRNQQKPLNEHFVFTGNPGTGKTTVARILADVFCAIGLLPTNNLIEADRSALVATTVGGTGPKTNNLVDKALGGVLFIDEAYNLNQGDQDNYGQDAVNTLLKRLEDDRGKFVCIVAGYDAEMDKFLSTNSGLDSRFKNKIHFDDYTAEEMAKIFSFYAADEAFTLAEDTKDPIIALFRGVEQRKTKNFGNARTVREVFEKTRDKLSSRVMAMQDAGSSAEDIQAAVNTITVEDLPLPESQKTRSLEGALAPLYEQIGLEGVKRKVEELVKVLKVQELRQREKPLEIHFVFTGNPGTGKTTVARILANVFHAIGLLPSNTLIEADRSKMVAGYQGQTSAQVNQLCDRAMGGVLFIDEAYALKQDPHDTYGQSAIDTLLKRMEDDRGKFIVIAAGYSKEMEQFLNTNSGLDSRFSEKIHFDDYDGEQMTKIFTLFAKKDGFFLAPDVEPVLREAFDGIYENRGSNFGNARTVRQIFSRAVEALSARVLELQQSGNLSEEELRTAANTITVADVTTEVPA
jgi:SpoVK/Ycf46/Vps4 family AAA+-type ATPase